MTKNVVIFAETGIKGMVIGSNYDAKLIDLELDILDEKISFQIGIRHARARLADIVPLARTICSKITAVALKNIPKNGGQIPCYKGCSACCKRCLVPLSVPEAFRLNDEIRKISVLRHELIWRDCLNASRHILTHKPPKKFTQQSAESLSNNPVHLNLISDWYSSLKLACPFLRQDICTIYGQRPLACREHYIIGSAKGCKDQDSFAEVLDIPIRVSNALVQLASELEGTTVEAVILPLILLWCKENKKRAERTWPFEMMVTRFVEIIKEMADKNSAVTT